MSAARAATLEPAARNAVFAAIAVTLLLYALAWWVPALAWLAWPLVLFSTIVHELGHGLTALALGADFERLLVYADGSGVAVYRAAFGPAALALVAAMGPLGPPLLAALLFMSIRRAGSARVALLLLGVGFLLAAALWARNPVGFTAMIVLGAGLLLIDWRASATVRRATIAFLAIQLSLAAFSRSDYLFTATASTGAGAMPSDTAQIANALGLTHWLWGALIAMCSLAILMAGVRLMLLPSR